MSLKETTVQQLDPLGALDSWPTTVLLSIAAVTYSAITSWVSFSGNAEPIGAAAAVLLVALVFGLLIWVSRPSGSPMNARSSSSLLALLLIASVLDLASDGATTGVGDSWVPYTVGIYFWAVAQYRPARQLAASAVVAALAVALAALVDRTDSAQDVFPIVTVLVAAGPVLGLGLGAAAYVADYTRSVVRWRADAAIDASAAAVEQRDAIVSDVHRDVLTLLNRELLPFFKDLLEKGTITGTDSENARRVSDAVRRILVADGDQNWLDALIRRGLAESEVDVPAERVFVDDPDRVVDEIAADGRAAIGALVSLLIRWSGRGSDPRIVVRLRASGASCTAVMEFADSSLARAQRAALRPYMSVMHVSFQSVRLSTTPGGVAIGFSYEHSTGR